MHYVETADKLVSYSIRCSAMFVGCKLLDSGLAVCHHCRRHVRLHGARCLEFDSNKEGRPEAREVLNKEGAQVVTLFSNEIHYGHVGWESRLHRSAFAGVGHTRY